jgi:hypothetical protein
MTQPLLSILQDMHQRISRLETPFETPAQSQAQIFFIPINYYNIDYDSLQDAIEETHQWLDKHHLSEIWKKYSDMYPRRPNNRLILQQKERNGGMTFELNSNPKGCQVAIVPVNSSHIPVPVCRTIVFNNTPNTILFDDMVLTDDIIKMLLRFQQELDQDFIVNQVRAMHETYRHASR